MISVEEVARASRSLSNVEHVLRDGNLSVRAKGVAEARILLNGLLKERDMALQSSKREAEATLGQFLAALPLDRIVGAGATLGDLIEAIAQVVDERDKAVATLGRLRLQVGLLNKYVLKENDYLVELNAVLSLIPEPAAGDQK